MAVDERLDRLAADLRLDQLPEQLARLGVVAGVVDDQPFRRSTTMQLINAYPPITQTPSVTSVTVFSR